LKRQSSTLNLVNEGFVPSRPQPVYENGLYQTRDEVAGQLRHLALIGIAATESLTTVRNKGDAMISLFEIMARLADEVAEGIEDLRGQLKPPGSLRK
jgi:hypothetical protein